ncbi:Mycobacterial persistence regulator A [Luteitalea pratensis]|uniref:Mycobacterial persistence regulator A n=1 Tax=Luteitalea pratensis TaxID=1855912 RepID=A0A143PJA2_LUTPR|nr:response regulator transcription factor [Luteitalea pratensis]AMY07849.1 Mycobacterial persistence regulator A [Luteitalea pratensis]
MARLLVVEDEPHLAMGLRFNLEADGHEVDVAGDGETALTRLGGETGMFDAVLLDVMLPGKNGFEVARELRARGDYVPILMLTARGRPEDVLQGFDAGVDDYLPKPFELPILLARMRSLLRRSTWARSAPAPPERAPEVYTFGGNTFDPSTLELRVGTMPYHLTAMEADLLQYLLQNAGKVVSRKAILEDVWDLHEDTDTRAIDNFIVRLRRFLNEDPSKPRHVITVRGRGYRFIAEPDDPGRTEAPGAERHRRPT